MRQRILSTMAGAALTAAMWTSTAVVHAAVTPDEAKQLGTTLTPLGAEMAGNKDGTIPAWSIEKTMRQRPAHYKPKDPRGGAPFVNTFPDEKPLFSITKENMARYEGKLDPGSAYLMKNREGYRMDVYPTRRTAAVPDWVYENTKKCATTTKLLAGGIAFEGAQACVPFAIPKNGYEAMWNMILYPRYAYSENILSAYIVDTRNQPQIVTDIFIRQDVPFWDPKLTTAKWATRNLSEFRAPAAKAGERALTRDPLRQDLEDGMGWMYTPGLRRVRSVPDQKYDTVVTIFGGIFLADEVGSFAGKMDRFDFKLKGKKEMYVPYNALGFASLPPEEVVAGRQFVSPNLMRWELHRVWEVEATLKEGKRHQQSRKVFYIDEDSWMLSAYAAYDGSNNIVKIGHNMITSLGADQFGLNTSAFYDVTRGIWSLPFNVHKGTGYLPRAEPFPANTFNPDHFGATGIR